MDSAMYCLFQNSHKEVRERKKERKKERENESEERERERLEVVRSRGTIPDMLLYTYFDTTTAVPEDENNIFNHTHLA